MSIKKEIEQVIEAATIRRDQWEGMATGHTVDGLTGELAEATEEEARNIAKGLTDALDLGKACGGILDRGEALTAMCIWEAALESVINDEMQLRTWLAGGEGAAAARDGCITLAPFFDEVWERASARGWDAPFDWEMVPPLLAYVVEEYNSPEEVAKLPGSAAQAAANKLLRSQDNA